MANQLENFDASREALPQAVYVLSAVHGGIGRVLNVNYSKELVFVHMMAAGCHSTIQQRVNEILTGQNPALGLPGELFSRVGTIVGELADRLESDDDLMPPLADLAAAAYIMTGNGFYLYQSRGLGL